MNDRVGAGIIRNTRRNVQVNVSGRVDAMDLKVHTSAKRSDRNHEPLGSNPPLSVHPARKCQYCPLSQVEEGQREDWRHKSVDPCSRPCEC